MPLNMVNLPFFGLFKYSLTKFRGCMGLFLRLWVWYYFIDKQLLFSKHCSILLFLSWPILGLCCALLGKLGKQQAPDIVVIILQTLSKELLTFWDWLSLIVSPDNHWVNFNFHIMAQLDHTSQMKNIHTDKPTYRSSFPELKISIFYALFYLALFMSVFCYFGFAQGQKTVLKVPYFE